MNPVSKSETYPSAMASESSSTDAAARDATAARAAVDAELVRRMRSKDERALGTFYDRWFPVVHGVVSRMLESPDDVEDVVEEAFWQAWRQAERFEVERGSVQTWLLTIARSRALDRLRARRRLREDPLVDATASEADTSAPRPPRRAIRWPTPNTPNEAGSCAPRWPIFPPNSARRSNWDTSAA